MPQARGHHRASGGDGILGSVSAKDDLDRFILSRQDRFVAELKELCAIPCEASDKAALDAAARWCRDRLRAAGFADARELRLDSAPALVAGETGSGRRTLVGVQHYDVQPAVPLELWKTPPYDPSVRDGAVYARGVDDNKGHLLLRIQAVEAHRAVFGELPIRVRFLIEGEEESGSPNLGKLLALEPKLTDADGALKEGGALDSAGRPQLSLGGKGILYCHFRVRTMSRDAHSGGATHYPNAAWRLAHAFATLLDERGRIQIDNFYDSVRQPTREELAMLERMPFDAEATRAVVGIDQFAFGRDDDEAKRASVFEPTCNICGIESGYNGPGSKTVIPCEATGKIDFRLVPDQDPAKIAELLRAHLDRKAFADVEFSAEEGEHPYRGAADAPLVRAVAAVSEEAFGQPAVLIPSSGGTSPMWVVCNARRMPNVTLGMGHPGAGAHAPNEHILLENYWRALRATARLYWTFATQA
jgi:acetylornithine deacetylase/succinyl-diaminopimelate desuccinylase-like protein